jgi:hypothetical protein
MASGEQDPPAFKLTPGRGSNYPKHGAEAALVPRDHGAEKRTLSVLRG